MLIPIVSYSILYTKKKQLIEYQDIFLIDLIYNAYKLTENVFV